jgi:hypothetical protein
MLSMAQYYHYTKDSENQVCGKEGRFILFTPATFFGAANIISVVN